MIVLVIKCLGVGLSLSFLGFLESIGLNLESIGLGYLPNLGSF